MPLIIKTSQYNQLTDWDQLPKGLGNVNITGTNQSMSVNIGGKNIQIRPLIEKAIQAIKTILIQKGIREIDTSPLQTGVQGLAVSNEPGKIHVDVDKISKQFSNSPQLPIVQNDGSSTDPDSFKQIETAIIKEILATIGHESQHHQDYWEEYKKYQNNPNQNGPNFQSVQESPGGRFENQLRNNFNNANF